MLLRLSLDAFETVALKDASGFCVLVDDDGSNLPCDQNLFCDPCLIFSPEYDASKKTGVCQFQIGRCRFHLLLLCFLIASRGRFLKVFGSKISTTVLYFSAKSVQLFELTKIMYKSGRLLFQEKDEADEK
jgi:hypothetical protein